MSINIDRFNKIIDELVSSAWRYPDELEIGENISDFDGVKVMFNNFGWNEEHQRNDDESVEEYLVFIHRDSGVNGFQFPEHQLSPFGIVHRPDQEIAVRAWFYKNGDRTDQEIQDGENEGVWEVEDIESVKTDLTLDEIMEAVERFASRYSM